MYIDAVRELRLQPCDLALLPTGEVFVLSWSTHGRQVELQLDAYDPDLGLLWSREVGGHAKGLSVDSRGTAWVLDRTGVSAFSRTGAVAARVEAPVLPNMEVAAIACVDDEVILAYHHTEDAPPCQPALVRLTHRGTIRWSSRLPFESIIRDRPTTWICGYLRAGELTVSGDALFAIYADQPRTGLGIGYAVSLNDGSLRYTTKPGAIDSVAARGAGEFLVGSAGLETVSYDAGGCQQTCWATGGRYAISDRDVRVVEMRAALPLSRLCRLMPDGTLVKGDLLEGFHTSMPYVAPNGILYFARDGMMIAAGDLLIDERLPLCERSASRGVTHTGVVAGAEGIFSTYTTNRRRGAATVSDPDEHVSGLVRLHI